MGDFKKIVTIHSQRVLHPPMLETSMEVVFSFYGASENGGGKCGVGEILKCIEGDIFSTKLSCGKGINTRGELLALWSLFFFSS
jgi:hypothetical protein